MTLVCCKVLTSLSQGSVRYLIPAPFRDTFKQCCKQGFVTINVENEVGVAFVSKCFFYSRYLKASTGHVAYLKQRPVWKKYLDISNLPHEILFRPRFWIPYNYSISWSTMKHRNLKEILLPFKHESLVVNSHVCHLFNGNWYCWLKVWTVNVYFIVQLLY